MVSRQAAMEHATADRPSPRRPLTGRRASARSGVAQLTLVEHAICPLDDTRSLVENLVHKTGFFYTDRNGHSKRAFVTISAARGLSANDEFYLWGLLALTFAQPEPGIEFWATPHYCLRQLGCLGATQGGDVPGRLSKGGVNYAQFRSSIKRLAGVFYQCDHFYDPIRGEHRDRGFGFLKYDLPIENDSSRAWRLVWDPLFFEYAQATVGRLFFDLQTYRSLDFASRRLFLVLHKIFYRNEHSPAFDVKHLAVNVLGFAESVDVRFLKVKILRCIEKLTAAGVLRLPAGMTSPKQLITKRAKGSYAVQFRRGPYFERAAEPGSATAPLHLTDSPLYDPLKTIGFPDARIRAILRAYKASTIRLWADITLAKLERDGRKGFTSSPEAYFLDNLKHAAVGKRTPPDWWRDLIKREEKRRFEEERRKRESALQSEDNLFAWKKAREEAFQRYIAETVGKERYIEVSQLLLAAFEKSNPRQVALEMATEHAERHFATGFRFPDLEAWLVQREIRQRAETSNNPSDPRDCVDTVRAADVPPAA